jgi:hypothetical protein
VANINDDTDDGQSVSTAIWGGSGCPMPVTPAACRHRLPCVGQDPAYPSFVTSPWSPTQVNAFESMLQLHANVANVSSIGFLTQARQTSSSV